jgi:hypothetical protein
MFSDLGAKRKCPSRTGFPGPEAHGARALPMDLFRQAQGQSLPKGAIYLRRDVARKKPQDSHGTLRLLNLCGIDI